MSPVVDILLLVICAAPVLAGPVRRSAEESEAAADVRPSAYYIAPSASSLLASIYKVASSAESSDTCLTMSTTSMEFSPPDQTGSATTSTEVAAVSVTSIVSDLPNYAAAPASSVTQTLFAYAPQVSGTTTESMSTQSTSHVRSKGTTTLTEYTTVAPGYGQETSSSSVSSSTDNAASSTASLDSYSTTQSISSEQTSGVQTSVGATTYGSSVVTSLLSVTAPAPYSVSGNSSVATQPSQYMPTSSFVATTSSYSADTSSIETPSSQLSASASQYGNGGPDSTTSQTSQEVDATSMAQYGQGSSSAPLVYGSITLTYSTPSETSISINPTQYVSAYPTSATEESTTHHHHHHSATASTSAPTAESTSAFAYPGPGSSSLTYSASSSTQMSEAPFPSMPVTESAPSLAGYGSPNPTTSDVIQSTSSSEAVLSIIPINPSSYAAASIADITESAQPWHYTSNLPELNTVPTITSSSQGPGISVHSINPNLTTLYVTVTTTDAGATATQYVTVTQC